MNCKATASNAILLFKKELSEHLMRKLRLIYLLEYIFAHFESIMHSKKRHIAKTITWRIIATATTFILTLIFFREDPNATSKATWVAAIETVLKMIIYYYHERIWYSIKSELKSSVRHLLKTITWRFTASLTTFLIAFFIFREDPDAMEKASGIAFVEIFLKMLFYYLHERAWHSSKFGLE